MMNSRSLLFQGCAIAGLACSASGTALAADAAGGKQEAAASTPPNEGPASRDGREEIDGDIVVTATREPTELRKAPVAVTSVSGENLDRRGIGNLNDLKQQLPSVQIGDSWLESRIAIRGVGGQSTLLGASPGVAYYVDGIYLERTGLATATFFDLDRIEVLRGPQGALYGRNATGGAINVIPNKPTPDVNGMVAASVGVDPWAYGVQGVLNGPLDHAGQLSGRLSVQRTFNQGYTRNTNVDGPRRFDDADDYSVRAQLRYTPDEALDVNLALDYQNQNVAGAGMFLLGTPSGAPTPAQQLGGQLGNLSKRTTGANLGSNEKQFYGATLSVSGLGDWGSLSLRAGAHHTAINIDTESDGTAVNYGFSHFGQRGNQQFGELVYNSPTTGPLRALVGVNVLHEIAEQEITVTVPLADRETIIRARIPTISYAVFARLTYALSESWRVFGGARYSYDRKKLSEFNNFLGSGHQRASWDDLTYEFGTSVDLSPGVSGYLKYATGFKAGGFQGGSLAPPFNPETNANIEVGLKGALPGALGRFSIAAFHTRYDDLQVNQIINFAAFITNAAKATINGVELEGTLNITPALRAELTASILDAKFDRFQTADSSRPDLGTLDLAGNSLPKAPGFSGTASLTYTRNLSSGGKISLGARYNWQDRVWFSEFNLPVSAQRAVGRIDVSLDFESPDTRWSGSLFVSNLTDEPVLNNVNIVSASLGSAALGNLDPGRHIGATLKRRF